MESPMNKPKRKPKKEKKICPECGRKTLEEIEGGLMCTNKVCYFRL